MAVFSIPQGIALAGITGVPPVYGLYTAIFPSFFYMFFATSKHNALVEFEISLDDARKEACMQNMRLYDLIENISNIHWPTVAISVSSFMFLIFSKEIMSPWLSSAFCYPIPFDLILTIVGITATNYAELSRRHHVKVVGNIPTEFPPASLPRFNLVHFIGVDVIAIALTAVAVHSTVAKIVEKRYKYKIIHGQEFYALGFAGILSSCFPTFPVTSVFARSVVGVAVGGSTQLTCFFSSLALVFVILYIGPAFQYLPQCILSTMIIVSQKPMFTKLTEFRELWPVFKMDFTIWLSSIFLTVCFDVGEGFLLATAFALLTTILRMQRPKWHFLSRDCNTGNFKEVERKNLEFVDGNVCVFRMDAPLIFISVDRFTTAVWESVKKWERSKAESFVTIVEMNSTFVNNIFDKKAKTSKGFALEDRCRFIIDCNGFPYVDYLGLTTLKWVVEDLLNSNIQTYLVVQRRDMRKLLEVTNFYDTVDRRRVFEKLEYAMEQAENFC
ncbi:STAS domain protein [Dictyocaulus viviparus]|uniref:STAS domain protein n=1 Tax=Dictyocaulus viviparus TaxID=29172 RepID=A0A0D8XXA2_DICVI|nr:STAS domain protein [Dictyocaulus viviparus]